MNETGTTATTVFYDTSGLYIPCWCGVNHRGEYALNDWAQHHCPHSAPLLQLHDPVLNDLLCTECGKVFEIDEEQP